MAFKKTQTSSGRYVGGKWIPETTGKDYDAESTVAASESTDRARKAMTTGAKPKVSTDEPADKNSVQYLAWRRRQKGKSGVDAAAALAGR
jgi:hypothetical protein